MSFLVDTNVLSELAKPTPNAGVQVWADALPAFTLSA